MDKTLKRKFMTDGALCAIFLLLVKLGAYADRLTGGINYLLSTFFLLILGIVLMIRFIKRVLGFLRNRNNSNLYPLIVYPALVGLIFFTPGMQIWESKPIIIAYYKGTQNQAIIKFRKDNTFQLNWSGVFGYNEWFVGKYKRKADTLFLTYHDKKPARFGTKILISKNELLTIDASADTTKLFYPFVIINPTAPKPYSPQ